MRPTSTASFVSILIALALFPMGGCVGMRFSIDLVPTSNKLAETRVPIESSQAGSGKIVLINVSGLIANARQGGLISKGENPVSRFAEALDKAATDKAVKAVIVRINSPGGTVTASDIMYRELVHFRETTGKPVVVLMADLAASGGYYLACGADHIVAHPTTITGSIGVIIQTINVSSGLSRIGITTDAITSGPNKAMGSPLSPMESDHRALLQGIVDEFYGNFQGVVMQARPGIADSDLDWVTDGRVVTGTQAYEIGLVDELGDLRTAFARARTLANLSSASLVRYHRPMQHVGSAFADTQVGPATHSQQQINLMQLNVDAGALFSEPGFYYLWDPTVW